MEHELKLKTLEQGLEKVVDKIQKNNSIADKKSELNTRINALESANRNLQSQIDILSAKKESPNAALVEDYNTNLKDLANQIRDVDSELGKEKRELTVINAAMNIMKGDGIRASVIAQYVPIINTLVNGYLGVLGFPVRIELDEQFNDTVRGRYVNEFTYNSLSQGERQRIDLAMVYAWRKVASICAGIDTNLLIMDEVADAAMDAGGIEGLMQLIHEEIDGRCALIISHRSEMSAMCDNTIVVSKVDGFSKIC
jgi:DNA repair exonuclease SbcCD ATPase subunit